MHSNLHISNETNYQSPNNIEYGTFDNNEKLNNNENSDHNENNDNNDNNNENNGIGKEKRLEDSKLEFGRNLLHYATFTGDIKLVDYLISKGADINLKKKIVSLHHYI